jgi:hypothetical protein
VLLAIKLLVAVTALGEVLVFGGFTDLPSDTESTLAVLAGIAWLLSPLMALVFASSGNQFHPSKIVTLFICSLLSAFVALWFLGPWGGSSSESRSGLGALVIPAIQWVVVIAGLITLGVLNRRQRDGTART